MAVLGALDAEAIETDVLASSGAVAVGVAADTGS